MNRGKTMEKKTIKPNRINGNSQKLTKAYPQPDGHGDFWLASSLIRVAAPAAWGYVRPAEGGKMRGLSGPCKGVDHSPQKVWKRHRIIGKFGVSRVLFRAGPEGPVRLIHSDGKLTGI